MVVDGGSWTLNRTTSESDFSGLVTDKPCLKLFSSKAKVLAKSNQTSKRNNNNLTSGLRDQQLQIICSPNLKTHHQEDIYLIKFLDVCLFFHMHLAGRLKCGG